MVTSIRASSVQLTPSLPTQGRLVTSGIAAGTALILLPFLFTAKPRTGSSVHMGSLAAAGLALAVGLSVFLRTLDFSIDYSLTPGVPGLAGCSEWG